MKLCGTTINFYVHINFKVFEKSQAWQKCASCLRFTDLCGKKSKNKKRTHMGDQVPDVGTFFFF